MTIRTGRAETSTRTKTREVTTMEKPEEVVVMLRLHAAGWGAKRIAAELGCSRNTVRRYVKNGGWRPYGDGSRGKALDQHADWVSDAFAQHEGNAEVVRQELVRERGVSVSLRTVERAVKEERRRRRAETVATVRFETAPGRQLQADFGERFAMIGGVRTKIHLCVLTLGYSRRLFVQVFRDERQANWLSCIEASFHHFGGVPREVLIDNARALVSVHNVETNEIVFSDGFSNFAKYWSFKPRACAPYRPRTKGKDERGVGYVKRNAIAGREFASWEALEAWLVEWTRDVADVRVHGTTGEQPTVRFDRDEATKLNRLPKKPPFLAERSLERKVHHDACVEVDANWYSVPWRLVKTKVLVRVREGVVTVEHGGRVVATHTRVEGRRNRVVDPDHWEGLTRRPAVPESVDDPASEPLVGEFERSLAAYEAAAGVAA